MNNNSVNNVDRTINENHEKIKWYLSTPFIIAITILTFIFFCIPGIILLIIRLKKYPNQKKGALIGFISTIAAFVVIVVLAVYSNGKDARAIDGFIAKEDYAGAKEYIDKNVSSQGSDYYKYISKVLEAEGNYDGAAEILLDYCKTSSLTSLNSDILDRLIKLKQYVSEDVVKSIDDIQLQITDAKAAEEKAIKEAEEKKAAEEKAAREEEEKKAAEEKAAREEEEKNATEEKAAREEEEKKAAKNVEINIDDSNEHNDDIKDEDVIIAEKDYEKIEQWITEHVGNHDSVKNSQVKNIKKITDENGFYRVWRDYLATTISRYDDSYYWDGRIKEFVQLYCAVWKDSIYSEEINEIDSYAANMDEAYSKVMTLRNKYPTGDIDNLKSGDFYVAQRLSTIYSDNIVGKIQKELNSYQPKETSDWVAYDFENDCYVIHADYLNPFSRAGTYSFAYVESDETMELQDEKGFVEEVPVLLLISDEEEARKDFTEIEQLLNDYRSNLRLLKKTIKMEESSEDSTLPDAYDVNAEYNDDAEIVDPNSDPWEYMNYWDWNGNYHNEETSLSLSFYTDHELGDACGTIEEVFRGNVFSGEIYYLGDNLFRWEPVYANGVEIYYVKTVTVGSAPALYVYSVDNSYDATFNKD